MIYPIRAYGDPVLRKVCKDIAADNPELQDIVSNMFATMDASDGVGLAAPQVGFDYRIFIVDSTAFKDESEKHVGIRQVFINPIVLEEVGKEWAFEEGCLSIPEIRENVSRQAEIKISYLDQDLRPQTKAYTGLTARVIQHEYDHIEGILFIDHLSGLKRQLLKSKLAKISKGEVNVHYRMKFPKRK